MKTLRSLLIVLPLLAGCAGASGGPSGPPRAAAGFPGFDTSIYPGDAAVREWRQASPYRWIGYYLPAPCHRETSWVGKRGVLEGMGFGLAVLYVGQQAFEGQAPPDSAGPIICSRTLLTAEQGRRDAQDAISAAEREGFPRGTVIFLDVERMSTVPPQMLDYLRAWLRELVRDGRYRPGAYLHRANAAELYLTAQQVAQEMGRPESIPTWIAGGGEGFTLEQAPRASGLPFADIWQGALDVDRTWGGRRLRIDENVATSPSPSAPGGT